MLFHKNYIKLLKSMFLSRNNPQFSDNVFIHRDTMVQMMIDFYRISFEDFSYKDISELPLVDKNTIDKSFLIDIPSFFTTTSGSRGKKFTYKIWRDCFDYIESCNHYRQILREFNFGETITTLRIIGVLNLEKAIDSSFVNLGDNVYFKISKPKRHQFKLSHGAMNATNYCFAFCKNDFQKAIRHISDLTSNVAIDIFLGASSFFKILIEELDKKICKLYSNTYESIVMSDIVKAKKKNLIDEYCDHMRCWDGGATFFTCKNQKYHLLDYMTYHESIEGKLICTDFLNIAYPFLRYWNGDMCEIGNTVKLCECGRFYKDFEFKGRQSFIWNGIASIEMFDLITSYDQFMQLICYDDYVKIVTHKELDSKIKSDLSNFFTFVEFDVNNFYSDMKTERIVDLR